MQYKSYQNKIERIAKSLSRVYARRFLILPIALLLLAALFAVLALKGTLLSVEKCPLQVEYGDSTAYKSFAFLGRTDLEYSPVGSEAWSYAEELPIGDYSTRAVAWSLSGRPRYSEVQSIRVIPRRLTLTLTGTELMYGNSPSYSVDGLRSGDRVEVKFTVLKSNDTEVTLRIDTESTAIYDQNGVDVTKNYLIEPTSSRVLTRTRRPISLLSATASKVFDFELLYDEGYTITSGSLVEGDRIEAVSTAYIYDASSTPNFLQYSIFDSFGQNVTHKYMINSQYGLLTVAPRPIHIATGSRTEVYSGNAIFSGEVWAVGDEDIAFVKEHDLTISSLDFPILTDCGTAENLVVPYIIKDGIPQDSSNFDFIYQEIGKLEIIQRPITVYTADGEFTFNGEYNSFPECNIASDSPYGMADGHELSAHTFIRARDAGEYINTAVVRIMDSNGRIVTDNYAITLKPGKIVGHKLALTLQPDATVKYFNGDPQIPDNKITDPTLMMLNDHGYTYSVKIVNSGDYPRYPGSYSSEIIDFELYSKVNGKPVDVTERNLELTFKKGVLEILPKKLTVITKTEKFYYTGDPVCSPGIKLESPIPEEMNGFASGHTYKEIDLPSFTEVGVYENKYSIRVVDMYGNDVSHYYELTYDYGRVTIGNIPFFISTESISTRYNGQPVDGGAIKLRTLKQFSSLEKYIIAVVDEVPGYTDVGQYENAVTVRLIDTRTGLDVTEEYELCYEFGIVTIAPFPITVHTQSANHLYDGLAHVFPFVSSIGDPLPVGHYMESAAPHFTNAGSYENTTAVKIKDIFSGRDTTHNFDITFEYGTVVIEPIRVNVATSSDSFTFDGKAHSFPEITNAEQIQSLLLEGHSFKMDYVPEFKNAGSYSNNITIAIYDENGVDVTRNYSQNGIYGRISVVPLQLTLTPLTLKKFYDGYPLTALDELEPNDDLQKLIDLGYHIRVKVNGKQTEVGEGSSHITSYTIRNEHGDIAGVTDNISVSIAPGKLIVLEGTNSYVLTLFSLSKQYDGTPLTLTRDSMILPKLPNGLSFEYINPSLSLTDVGSISVDNINSDIVRYFDYKIVDEAGNDRTSELYISVNTLDGTPVLTVKPRELHLLSASETAVYSGKPLTNTEVIIYQGSLASGHKLHARVETSLDLPDGMDEISAENVILVTLIHDETGLDVTENYNIVCHSGTLTLKR